jgi:F-type H+-transporting ATPase subunit b
MSGWTLLFQVVNFVVLAALLRRFLFKPVMAMVAKRQQEIERAASEGARARHEAEELRAAAAKALALASETRERALGEARAEAERQREAMLAETRLQERALRDASKRELAIEKENTAEKMASGAVEIGTSLARRLLGQLATAPIAEMFLTRLCADLEGLSDERRRALLEDLGASELLVATAPRIDPGAEKRWRDEIAARLGTDARPRLVSDDSLIAGAELRFPHSTISLCWRDGIEAARKELISP